MPEKQNDLLKNRLEQVALNALPALEQIVYDGWILRYAEGFTKRANSANFLFPSMLPCAQKIAYCEAYYRRKQQSAIFRIPSISPDTGIDPILDSMGYQKLGTTLVMDTVLNPSGWKVDKALDFRLLDSEEWIAAYFAKSAPENENIFQRLISKVPFNRYFAAIYQQGQPVCFGLGVLEDGYLGFFNIHTLPEYRHKGYALKLMHGMGATAVADGAQRAYLQVEEENTPARHLYQKLGFEMQYLYWYRQKNLN